MKAHKIALLAAVALFSGATGGFAENIKGQYIWHDDYMAFGHDETVDRANIASFTYSQYAGTVANNDGGVQLVNGASSCAAWVWERDDSFPAGQAFELLLTFTVTTENQNTGEFLYGYDDAFVDFTNGGAEWRYDLDEMKSIDTVGEASNPDGYYQYTVSTTIAISGETDHLYVVLESLGTDTGNWGFTRTMSTEFTPIPEPSSFALLALVCIGTVSARRLSRRRA